MYLFAHKIRCAMLIVLALLLLCIGVTQQSAIAADLVGTVVDESGKPLAGALVDVYTARPKTGPERVCPSCYVDCQKEVLTNEKGEFKIADVSAALYFNLFIVKPGYIPCYAKECDPTGKSAALVVKQRKEATLKGPKMVRGRVLNAAGKPVPGAIATPEGYCHDKKDDPDTWGTPEGDPFAVTDEKGEFNLLVSDETITGVTLEVSGPNLARKKTAAIPKDATRTDIRLDAGVMLQGRVTRDGKGIADIRLSLISQDRDCSRFFSEQCIETDKSGKFTFYNVPSGVSFYINVPREKAREIGLAPTVTVTTGKAGSTNKLADIVLVPGTEYTGKITLADGAGVPDKADASVLPTTMWSPAMVPIAADGTFRFLALPGEDLEISLDVPDYLLSPVSPFYQAGYGDKSTENITFSTPPLATAGADSGKAEEDPSELKRKEAKRELVLALYKKNTRPPGYRTVHARVLSPEGKPVTDAVVAFTPVMTDTDDPMRRDSVFVFSNKLQNNSGRLEPESTAADGTFTIDIPEQNACILIHSVAHGYLCVHGAEIKDDLKLKPWKKLSGTALWKGKPAAAMKIFFSQQIGFEPPKNVRIFTTNEVTTDAEGRFTFHTLSPGDGTLSRMLEGSTLDNHVIDPSTKDLPEIVLGKGGVTLAGKIRYPTPDGKPGNIFSREVFLSREPLSGLFGSKAYFPEDGSYSFENVEPGQYSLNGQLRPSRSEDARDKTKYFSLSNSPDSSRLITITEEQVKEGKAIKGPDLEWVPARITFSDEK